jgi:hypothetical protein
VEVTCFDLVLVRIWKKVNNDDMRIPNLLGNLLTLIIKELKIIVEVVKTLNAIKH